MTMHPRMQEHLAAYASYYSLLKKPRALQWRHTLGVTKLNLSFEDGRTISVSVSPPLANLILHFQEKSTWTLADLANCYGLSCGNGAKTNGVLGWKRCVFAHASATWCRGRGKLLQ